MKAAATTDTLLVFTLGPRREQRRRRLLPARWGAAELALHRQGLEAALEAGRSRGCRLTLCAPEPQEVAGDVDQRPQPGASFADRLLRALDGALAEAPGGRLVVVGSDTPGLGAAQVGAALDRLGRDDPDRVVVGPSPDGGFYLLALSRPLGEDLAGVRWCRADTLDSLLGALAAAGREVVLLPPLRDLDRRSDLERWLAESPSLPVAWKRLAAALAALLRALARPPALRPRAVPAAAGPAPARGRAPPR